MIACGSEDWPVKRRIQDIRHVLVRRVPGVAAADTDGGLSNLKKGVIVFVENDIFKITFRVAAEQGAVAGRVQGVPKNRGKSIRAILIAQTDHFFVRLRRDLLQLRELIVCRVECSVEEPSPGRFVCASQPFKKFRGLFARFV